MNASSRLEAHKSSRPRFLVATLIALVLSLLLAGVVLALNKGRFSGNATVDVQASASSAFQDPNQAENYRRLAAAKRKAGERVPEKKQCYEVWAKYYDCLADRAEYGDNRECPEEPQCK